MRLKFEKASDVNDDHCHLDVFHEGHATAFMDVSVGDDGRPRFNLYCRERALSLSVEEWVVILRKAEAFTAAEIEAEGRFGGLL